MVVGDVPRESMRADEWRGRPDQWLGCGVIQRWVYPWHAPAFGRPLHSRYRRRSRSTALSSDGLRWCFILTEPFFLGDALLVVLFASFLGVPRASSEMVVRLSAMHTQGMAANHLRSEAILL